jgi:hypothetical protein
MQIRDYSFKPNIEIDRLLGRHSQVWKSHFEVMVWMFLNTTWILEIENITVWFIL